MRGLDRVTITGADDSISAHELKSISRQFPFVEWGILFSQTQQGTPRFPTESWIAHLPVGPTYCAHLCGRYVRDIVLDAKLKWIDNRYNRSEIFNRVQLNFHGQFHKGHPSLGSVLDFYKEYQFILQCDGVNDSAVEKLCAEQTRARACSPLFDTSGGAGRLPDSWPRAWEDSYCGYAGGLGPDNVLEQLDRIYVASMELPFWIDMERRVRSEDDWQFDLQKVGRVLELCAPLVSVPQHSPLCDSVLSPSDVVAGIIGKPCNCGADK